MRLVQTAEQFNEVLETARRSLDVRQSLETFESERLGMYADLTRDWLGAVRDEFDEKWTLTGELKIDVIEELEAAERDLADLWARSVEEHNEHAYDQAIQAARWALQGEREEHNALIEAAADLDAMTFGIFNDKPEDRVPRAGGDVPQPTAGDNFAASNSFVHYQRTSDNYWYVVWQSYPNPSVCEVG